MHVCVSEYILKKKLLVCGELMMVSYDILVRTAAAVQVDTLRSAVSVSLRITERKAFFIFSSNLIFFKSNLIFFLI